MWRAIVFDLDDTLYRELDFVESGWRVVSAEVERRYGISQTFVFSALSSIFAQHGRDRTFDRLSQSLGVGGELEVLEWVELYRYHSPEISLYSDARVALDGLQRSAISLGLLTDGDPAVQRNKARALELRQWVQCCRFTWDSGSEHQKPHRQAYAPLLESIGIDASSVVYVGDNPNKDFVGARALGMPTIRLRRGPYATLEVGAELDADRSISELTDLLELAWS